MSLFELSSTAKNRSKCFEIALNRLLYGYDRTVASVSSHPVEIGMIYIFGRSNIFLGRSNLHKMHLCLISPEKPRRGICPMFYTSKISNLFDLSGAKRVNREGRKWRRKEDVLLIHFVPIVRFCTKIHADHSLWKPKLSKLPERPIFWGSLLNINSNPKRLYTSASKDAGDKFHVWRSLRLRIHYILLGYIKANSYRPLCSYKNTSTMYFDPFPSFENFRTNFNKINCFMTRFQLKVACLRHYCSFLQYVNSLVKIRCNDTPQIVNTLI